LPLLQAIKPVLRQDIPTALFIAPYCVQIAVCKGGRAALNDVTAEVLTVLQAEGSSRDSVLCMQAVFTLLDVLQRWYEEAKAAYISSSNQISSGSTAGTTSDTVNLSTAAFAASEWPKVSAFLSAIPKNTVARAAVACGAHARALLHYETYLRATRGHGGNPAGTKALPSYGDDEVTFLLEIYSKLEEPDGLEGLMKLRQGGPRPEDQRLAAEKAGSWGEALTLYERDLARQEWPAGGSGSGDGDGAGTSSSKAAEELWSGSQRGYLNCLLQMGHWQGLLAQVEGMTSLLGNHKSGGGSSIAEIEAPRLAAMGSAAAWRLGRWQQLDRYLENVDNGRDSALNPDERWEARIGLLLRTAAAKARSGGNASSSLAANSALAAELDAARAEVMGPFSAAAMESYSRAYSHLVKLHMLQEVADAAALMGSGPKERRRTLRWDERLSVVQPTLTTQVPILALRRQLAALSGAMDAVGKCWLQHAQLCRSTGHYDAAVPAVLEAAAVGIPGASFERVELLYAKGEQHRAISELHILDSQLAAGGGDAVNLTSEADKNRYRARVILRLAEWTVETGQGTHDDVTSLFENALSLRTNWETGLFKYACYLDELMQDARARQGGANGAAGTSHGGASGSNTTGVGATIDRLGGKSRIKLGEDRHHLTFLPEVLRNYGRSVQYGNRHIYRSLPRLLTLWFDFGAMVAANPNYYGNEHRAVVASVKELMEKLAKSIPSHCWLISLPQLISRICHKNTEVAFITRHIVIQTMVQYPQQGLWQMAAVSKSGLQARRSAASGILSSAKKAAKTEDERTLFAESNGLCEQLIKLCHSNPASNKKVVSVRKDLGLATLARTMPLRVMIPTMLSLTPALPPPGLNHTSAADRGWRPFGEPVTIIALQDEVQMMTSLQKPKRIVLIGSDGSEYPYLAKPKDDLRKDCRMMEAAGVMNRIFEAEPAARRRNLHIRRFAVVPITEDCGIIEWVCPTKPLRHCIQSLAESPQEIKAMQKYAASTHDRANPKGKAALVGWLEDMLRVYPPTFHRWFLATWAEPAAWLNARLNYTRSYAVWCMVGHIAGLGDRHGENVLLDMQSGETIQIDFGCLFDKGLTLALPEVVPFRLTQNVIDGFGVAGVEGVFRRSCETTLSVLRKHCGTILSVMDTFVHDPLVEWARDEKKLRNVAATSGVAEAENPQAKDAMATIEGRLKGTLLGVSARPCMPLSVEGHVHRLIVEATAKENLSRMYIWWAPFQ
jgi:serine/threonine-protein kinase ATR